MFMQQHIFFIFFLQQFQIYSMRNWSSTIHLIRIYRFTSHFQKDNFRLLLQNIKSEYILYKSNKEPIQICLVFKTAAQRDIALETITLLKTLHNISFDIKLEVPENFSLNFSISQFPMVKNNSPIKNSQKILTLNEYISKFPSDIIHYSQWYVCSQNHQKNKFQVQSRKTYHTNTFFNKKQNFYQKSRSRGKIYSRWSSNPKIEENNKPIIQKWDVNPKTIEENNKPDIQKWDAQKKVKQQSKIQLNNHTKQKQQEAILPKTIIKHSNQDNTIQNHDNMVKQQHIPVITNENNKKIETTIKGKELSEALLKNKQLLNMLLRKSNKNYATIQK